MSANRKPRHPGRWKQTIEGPFAPRTIAMLESPAYRVLSLTARRILDRVEIELAHHGGNDNGTLPVTYDHFMEYGIHRHAIGPAIREAASLGFLEITEHGRAGNAEFRSPNKYRLTYRHVDKARPTNEWRRIATMEEAVAIARAARGRTGKPYPEYRGSDGIRTMAVVTETGTGKCSVPVVETGTETWQKPALENKAA